MRADNRPPWADGRTVRSKRPSISPRKSNRSPDAVTADIVQLWKGAPLEELSDNKGPPFDADTQSAVVFELLTDLIATGRAGPSQTSDILQLLEAMPAVTMTNNADGSVSATHEVMSAKILAHLSDATFTLDPSTGHPIRMQSNSDPSYRIDYISVTPVRLADYVKVTDGGTTEQSPPSTVEGP